MTERKPPFASQWATGTLNFIYGCQKISPGCDNCYIDRPPWNLHLSSMKIETPFDGKVHYFNYENQLRKLDHFPNNSIIWTNGLGDTFAEFIPDSRRERWHDVFESRPQYQFVICTKRPGKMMSYYKNRKVPKNVWIGVTVESRRFVPRIDLLRRIDAKIRWVSFEPLLEDIGDVDLTGIQWVATGGETEPNRKYRIFKEEWTWNIKTICQRDGPKFWFAGGNGVSDSNRSGGSLLYGETCLEYPPFDRFRQPTLP
jgi:protein gp37